MTTYSNLDLCDKLISELPVYILYILCHHGKERQIFVLHLVTPYIFTGLSLGYFLLRVFSLAVENGFDLLVVRCEVAVDLFDEIVGVGKDVEENCRVASQYSGPVPQ